MLTNYTLFLDDVRDPPDYLNVVVVRSAEEAQIICSQWGWPARISFDHDLGDGVPTGMDFAKWLIEQDQEHNFLNETFDFKVHSANPPGKANIEGLLNSYLRFKGVKA